MSVAAIGYLLAVVIAVVFWAAATAKVIDPGRVAREFDQLGIRRPDTAARVLPAVEFGVAVLLVAVPWVGAAVALAVLVGFTVVLVRVLRSGASLSCACFGAASSQPVSTVDVVRNVALVIAAGVALAAERVAPTPGDIVVVGAVVAVVMLALAALRRRGAEGTTVDRPR